MNRFLIASFAILATLVGCSAGADGESDSDDALSTDGGRVVVHIGDSVSVGEFGTEILKQYASEPLLRNVNFYAACGSKPFDWLPQPNGSKRQALCGYEERHADGSKVDDPWRAAGTPPHDIPWLQDILAQTKPSVVVIQLGLNMLEQTRSDGTLDAAHVSSDVGKLKSIIFTGAAPTSRACVWIAPGVAPHFQQAEQDMLFHTLTGVLGGDCLVIDGRPLTQASDVGSDGIHPRPEAARRFADSTFNQIRSYVASHPAR